MDAGVLTATQPTPPDFRGGKVVAVSSDAAHRFSKPVRSSIRLVEGFGIEGDAHAGRFVKHRWLAKQDRQMENLRQVHLMHEELFDQLREQGFKVAPGDLGENITTRGIDLLSLPLGCLIHLGETAVLEATGVRMPCGYIDRFQKGLKRLMISKTPEGKPVYKSGIMAIVRAGGAVAGGDPIRIVLPSEPWATLPPL
jgi:MOSC domain-containing protein YiiM